MLHNFFDQDVWLDFRETLISSVLITRRVKKLKLRKISATTDFYIVE